MPLVQHMRIAPAKRRSVFQDAPEGCRIVIPAKPNIFLLVFLAAWLGGWVMGEMSAIRELTNGKEVEWFLIFWLVGWTAGGAFAISMWLWMAFGKEIVGLRSGELSIRREALGVGLSKEFDLTQVRNLRVSQAGGDSYSAGMRFWGLGGGFVAFDYGAKTYRFGSSLDEAEATQVVADLRTRHAFEPAA